MLGLQACSIIPFYAVLGHANQALYQLCYISSPNLHFSTCICVSGMHLNVHMCVGACLCAGVSACGEQRLTAVFLACLPFHILRQTLWIEPRARESPLCIGNPGGWPHPPWRPLGGGQGSELRSLRLPALDCALSPGKQVKL